MTANGKSQKILYILIPAFFVLGAVLGLLAPEIFPPIAFLGEIYVRLLKLIVVPLLMCTVFNAVFRTSGSLRGRLLHVLLLFILMFVVSFLITAAAVLLIKPGADVVLEGAWEGETADTTLSGFFKTVISDNLIQSMANGALLPLILLSFASGLAGAKLKTERLFSVTEDAEKILMKILSWVMWTAPLGVFALIGNAAASSGTQLFGTALKYILTAWGCTVLVTLLVMIVPVWIFAKIPPHTYLRKILKVWTVSLSTCSSAATLPTTIRVCNEEFGVPEYVTGIVVPLGCTIHMCGGAVSFCLLGLFTLQASSVPLTFGLFLYMLTVAVLMNMAAPGIPGGGIVLGATYLSVLGAPTGFIGLYSGIYRLLDMAYTTLNVTGDVTANVLIHTEEKRKQKEEHA